MLDEDGEKKELASAINIRCVSTPQQSSAHDKKRVYTIVVSLYVHDIEHNVGMLVIAHITMCT